MKFFILLAFITLTFTLTLDLTVSCGCADYKQQVDCKGSCIWGASSCRNLTCRDLSETVCKALPSSCKWNNNSCETYTVVCKDFTTEESCDSLSYYYNCAWNNYLDACAEFTICSDYVPGIKGCLSKSSRTKICIDSTDKTVCENAPTSCTSLTTESTCLTKGNILSCIWESTCKAVTSCGMIKSQANCEKFSACVFDTNCREKVCSDFKSEASCTYISYTSSKGTLCKWNTKCTEATDVSSLTAVTCKPNTGYTYTWDGNQCSACTGQGSNYGAALSMMVGLMVLFI